MFLTPIRGAGGGGKSGDAPTEAPDDLFSDATAYIIDVLGEGPIEGWADPAHPRRCVYLNGTPIENDDGSLNFEGVEFWLRTGTEDQPPVPGFATVETQIGVNVEVTAATPVARTITSADVDAVGVTVAAPTLLSITDSGDRNPAKVVYAIETQVGAAGWTEVARRTIKGKNTSGGFQSQVRVELPAERPVSVRVVRLTPDSSSDQLTDNLFFSSYTEVIDAKFTYPDTAYVAIALPAEAFGGQLPSRSYRVHGYLCLTPSNYDPVARTYAGVWDGTFQRAWTQNPAWALYTALVEGRWGLGDRLDASRVNKWALYAIGQRCDELVDDGAGGQEPRYSINGALTDARAAFEVIRQLSTLFRGLSWFGGGAVQSVDDAPRDPVALFTTANVIGGDFDWSSTALEARKTSAIGEFPDITDQYRLKQGVSFDDAELVARYGVREITLQMPLTVSRGEAMRACKWAVETNGRQRQTVAFTSGMSGAAVRPGDTILVSDPGRIGLEVGGRLRQIQSTRLMLDRPVTLDGARSYAIWVETATGLHRLDLAAAQSGSLEWVELAAAKTITVPRGAVWALTETSIAPRLMRVVSNQLQTQEVDGATALTFSVVAVEEDPGKWARVEGGLDLPDLEPYRPIPVGPPPAPTSLQATSYWRADPGSISKLRSDVSWERGTDSRVTRWRVQVSPPAGPREDAVPGGYVYQPSADILLPEGAGVYEVHVRAETVAGDRSIWADITLDTTTGVTAPPPPSNLAAAADLKQIRLSWTRPATPELRGVEVAYSAINDVATAVSLGEVMADGVAIPGLIPSVPVYAWARTVTHAELSPTSDWAGPVVATPKSAADMVEDRGGLAETGLATEVADKINDALADSAANGSAINAIDVRLTLAEGGLGNQAIAISQLQTDVSDVQSQATATDGVVASIQSDVGDVTATVATQSTAITTIEGRLAGEHTVVIDLNGRVSGFRLYDDGQISDVEFVADVFRIAPTAGATARAPFVFQSVNGTPRLTLDGELFAGTINASALTIGASPVRGLYRDEHLEDHPYWTLLDGWQFWDNGATVAAVQQRGFAFVSPTSGAAPAEEQYFAPLLPASPGREYVLRCWVERIAGGTNETFISLDFFTGIGAFIESNQSPAFAGMGPQELVTTGVAPPAARLMRARFRRLPGAGRAAFGHPDLRERTDGVSLRDGVIEGRHLVSDSAIIGSAQIQNLAVGTLKIANQAITDHVSAYAPGTTQPAWSATNEWANLISATITTPAGARVTVLSAFDRAGGFWSDSAGGGADDGPSLTSGILNHRYRLIRQTNGGGILQRQRWTSQSTGLQSGVYSDSPPAGTHVYTIQWGRRSQPTQYTDYDRAVLAERSIILFSSKK